MEVPRTRVFVGPNGKLPVKATIGSSGFDIFSAEDAYLFSEKVMLISTDLFMEIPVGYELQIRSRSGLAANSGIFVLNSPGTIDSDYRGEIKIIIANFSKEPKQIKKGDKIAQGVFAQVPSMFLVQIDNINELGNTVRGVGGFGSTGK